jgi:hypothetical protein
LAYSAALLGLGVFDKASFLWFIIALAVAGLFVWITSARRPPIGVRDVALAGGTFLFTSGPFWAYNLSHRWITFRLIAAPGEKASVEKLIEQLPARTATLLDLLRGRAVDEWMFGQAVRPGWGISETVLLPVTILAFVAIVIACIAAKRPALLALPLLLAAFAVQIYATPRPVWVHHWIGLYPLPHLMVGLMGGLVLRWSIGKAAVRRVAACVVALLLGIAVTCNVVVMRGYHRLMAEQRTSLPWSDAIFALAANLKAGHPDRTLQIMDWGAYNQLNLLSAGRLHLRETFWTSGDSGAPSPEYLSMLADPASLFIFVHGEPDNEVSRSRRMFDAVASRAGLVVTSEQTFSDRYGRVVYSVVGLSRSGGPAGRGSRGAGGAGA